MKVIVKNEQTKNKELYYEEGFWTGKRTIKYNGISLTKIKRNLYEYKEGETTENFEIKGNQLIGVTIKMFGNVVEVARKLTWYEIVMSLMVFIPCILFGAIGGAFGCGLGFANLTIIRNLDKLWLKFIISLQFAIVALLMSYIFAYLILKTFLII
ncbi:MAG: hypothetical protein IKT27_00265 [Clostridia bacterium]|nr:hypothetical protein [Clostridia bacterium]